MTRDLSVNRKGGGCIINCQFATRGPAFHKTQFYEIGSKNARETLSLLKMDFFRFRLRAADESQPCGF
ncbi:MAG: hypothetical protein DRJ14_09195, partial [Acidobacteria bacterium]